MRYFIFLCGPPDIVLLRFRPWARNRLIACHIDGQIDRQTDRTSVRIAADMQVLNAMTQDGTKERILHSVRVWVTSFTG